MERQTLSIPRISNPQCVAAIKAEVGELFGVRSVEGNAETKTITVEWEIPTDLEIIKIALEEINYPGHPIYRDSNLKA